MSRAILPSRRLWLAVRFPHWVWQAQGLPFAEDEPALVVDKNRVIWASPAALMQGVQLGMAATTAEALAGCLWRPRAPLQEAEHLKMLAELTYQITPYIELYESSRGAEAGLLLEVSSCLNLFGGFPQLIIALQKCLAATAMTWQLGQSHSAYGAWLLSFMAYPLTPMPPVAEGIARLKQLPIHFLQDYPKEQDMLASMGFATLGDIAQQIEAQSLSGIKKRFGAAFSQLLSELFVLDTHFSQASLFEQPLRYYQPREYFEAHSQFDYPVAQLDYLHAPMAELLKKLEHYLRQRQLATQHIEWTLADIYRQQVVINVYADGQQSRGTLFLELTFIQLESLAISFAVDSLTLRAPQLQPLESRTGALEFEPGTRKKDSKDLTLAAAKIKARLGDSAMVKISYKDSHIPEESNQEIPLNIPAEHNLPDIHLQGLRPAWLFKEPIAIEERNGLYWRGRLQILLGPERIQSGWWQGPIARDYYLAVRHDHVRLWIFWDIHQKKWFVHGFFQ